MFEQFGMQVACPQTAAPTAYSRVPKNTTVNTHAEVTHVVYSYAKQGGTFFKLVELTHLGVVHRWGFEISSEGVGSRAFQEHEGDMTTDVVIKIIVDTNNDGVYDPNVDPIFEVLNDA